MTKYTINELANSKGVSQPVREALLHMEAELEATNRQVEILSDALAESRRNIDAMVALVRADERKACAKKTEEFAAIRQKLADQSAFAAYQDFRALQAAIRARGNT